MLLLRAAGTAPPPRTIDLLSLRRARCESSGEDIVVCAPRDEFRLEPLAPQPVSGPPDGPLPVRLPGDGEARLHAIETTLPGASGKGAAVTVRIPLGRK